MANMQLPSRLGVAPLAMKRLVSPAARLNWQSASCSLNKFHSNPKNPQVLYVKDVESFRRLETTHVGRAGQPINSPWSKQEMGKLTSQDGTQVTLAHTWKSKHLLNVALFGNRGHGMLTRLKCCLLPPSQQLMPVRHYVYPIPDQLEPWTHSDEKYGMTFTSYLSEQNVEMLRIIAQPEFSMFYLFYYGKQVHELLAENPTRRTNITRVTLTVSSIMMLTFIHKNGLATKGIFKAPDSSTKVKKLKEDIEANFYKTKNYEISNEYNAHDVAAALKDFIAQLQKPLLTTPVLQFFPDFFRREKPLPKMLIGLNYYIMMMTPEHRDSLQLFLEVLHALTQNSAKNGLTVQDCGDIFGPVLFTLPPDCSEEEAAKRKKQFVDLTRVLVHYNEYLFTVPDVMLNKLRRVQKAGDKPSPKANKPLKYRLGMDAIQNAILHVRSPEFKDGFKEIIIGSRTTAEEIVKSFTDEQVPMERLMEKLKCPILGKKSITSHFLFENGGNLGYSEERALDPKTKVMLLWRENSSLRLIIKTWQGYNEEMSVKVVGDIKSDKPVYGETRGKDLLPAEDPSEDEPYKH